MTELIFYHDAYQKTGSARVRSVTQQGTRWAVLLDRTIFYPEGGGQPADKGMLAGIPVADVRRDGDEVIHLLDQAPPLVPGDSSLLELDWGHRYDFMQQHTGQHIISGVLHQDFGISTVSVHQGDEVTTIETDCADLTEEQLFSVTLRVQQIIGENLPVAPNLLHESDAQLSKLRREPKVSGTVRVISLGGYDHAACGGVHLRCTGEVLLAMCTATEKIRGRIRTAWKIGERALRDYHRKHLALERAGTLSSAPPLEVPDRLEKLLEENRSLVYEKNQLKRQRAADMVQGIFSRGETAAGYRVALESMELDDPELLKHLPGMLPPDFPSFFCLAALVNGEVRWCIAASPSLKLPFQQIRSELLPLIEGKGGGKPPFWQGAGKDPSGTESFLYQLREFIVSYIRRSDNEAEENG